MTFSLGNFVRNILLLGALWISPGWLQAEEWRFEAAPEEPGEGLQVLSRTDGNMPEAADPTVTEETNSTRSLGNPALMWGGEVAQFELGRTPWTLSGWFRSREPAGAMQGAQVLAGTRQSSSRFLGWDLCMENGSLRFYASPPAGTGKKFATVARYDDNKWHRFTLVWDASAQTVALYVDNQPAGSIGEVPYIPANLGQTFTIGAKVIKGDSAAPLGRWMGEIDEWKFEPATVAPPQGAADAPVSAPMAAAPAPQFHPGTSALRLIPLTGQAALTWKETAAGRRKILASSGPITESNRSEARVIAEDIVPGSANDWYEDPKECPRAGAEPPRGWLLGPETAPLPREDGAFVYTFRTGDADGVYFAVAAEGEPIEPGRNATVEAARGAAAPVEPIPQSREVVEAMKNAPAGLPVLLELHAHTGRPSGKFTHLLFGNAEMGWRDGLPFKFKVTVNPTFIHVQPYDRVWINRKLAREESQFFSYEGQFRNIETMWYGTSTRVDSQAEKAKGVAVNFTDRWVLAALEWVVKNYRADAARVYGCGTSMGTSIQRMAFANPGRFALVDVLVPIVDWSFVAGKDDLARRLLGMCGPITMPTDKGTTLADEVNAVRMAADPARKLPFVIVRSGVNDLSAFWRPMPDYFRAMEASRHGLLAGWDDGDHVKAMRASIPHFPDFRDVAWYGRFALNESFAAVTDFSLDSDYGDGSRESAAPPGFINRGLEWKVLADRPELYQIQLTCSLPNIQYPVTLAVTPRRLQNFKPAEGETLLARNEDAAGKLIAETRVTADAAGVVTLPGVSLTSQKGNILTLKKTP